jgi:hypothetical protein
VVGVLVEQGVEDGASLVAILGEVVPFLDVVRALAAAEGGWSNAMCATRSKGSRSPPLGTACVSTSGGVLLLELSKDGLLAFGLAPALQKLVH